MDIGDAMRTFSFYPILVLTLSRVCFAGVCPAKSNEKNYAENIVKAIHAATNCEDGASIAEACAIGGRSDEDLAVIAEKKCGLDFLVKLQPREKATYSSLQMKCDHKYKKMEGTMYLSANAFCKLRVARLYSELYTKLE